jgi:hypothetical protein
MFLPGTNVKTPKFADRIGKPIEIRGRSGPKRKKLPCPPLPLPLTL